MLEYINQLDKERVNVVKLALRANHDVNSEVFAQSRQQILDDMAKNYGRTSFNELSEAQQLEVLEQYDSTLVSAAHDTIKEASVNKKTIKIAQSYWWGANRYQDMLSKKQIDGLTKRVSNILASKRTWPKGTLINSESTEKVLTKEFMSRFLTKLVPFRSDDYINDDSVLHVCVAMFLRNYPHLQAQYSTSFIPLQKVREDEEAIQNEQEPSPFFSDSLKEKTASMVIVSEGVAKPPF